MLENEQGAHPQAGGQVLSYALGELDKDAQAQLDEKLASNPALKEELEQVRSHLRVHSNVRKVAPRRGSFDRLRLRMKKQGSFDGAIPGKHCMLRRSFMLSMLVGIVAIGLLIAFSKPSQTLAAPDVIGQIVFHNPSIDFGRKRGVVEGRELKLKSVDDKPESTGAYDAYIWLPTGVRNTYSAIEVAENSEFRFIEPRRLILERGFLRRLQIEPGGINDGPFVVVTPHCSVEIDRGSLSIKISRDGAETQVQVGEGSARVLGIDSDRAFVVPAGYATEVERSKLPNPARPVLSMSIQRPGSSRFLIQATLRNEGFMRIKIRRAVDAANVFKEPVYMLYASHVSEYDSEGGVVENVTLPTMPITPEAELSVDHEGEMWLEPGEYYRFNFDISNLLIGTPPVEHWLRLVYQGDLYGPPGEAKVRIESPNMKLDLRR